MFDVDLLIPDAAKPRSPKRTFERVNPLTGAVATRAVAATVEDACAAAASAAAAFPAWSLLGPGERRARLSAAADEIEARKADFIEAMSAEIGATDEWCRFNIALAGSMLREAAAMTTAICGEVIPSAIAGTSAMALRKPVGVVLSVAPWNAPVALGVRSIAMPLACGNTVVFKGSEVCPRTHWLVGQTFRAAGCGEGVVNVISNAPSDASRVIETSNCSPDGSAREFHRIDARWPACGGNRSPSSEACAARTGGKGRVCGAR